MRGLIVWGFMAGLVWLSLPQAQAVEGILVWRLEAKTGVNEKDIDSISGIITAEVEKYSGRKVVSEADIQTLLKGEETRQKCGENSTSCIAEIGAAMGVPEVVSGDLGKIGELWVLNLRRINVRDATVAGRSNRQVEGTAEDVVAYIPGAAAELFGKAAPPLPGLLLVTSTPEGASVKAGSRELGRTPLKRRLEPGDYDLTVEAEGYRSDSRKITLKPGEKVEQAVALEKYPMNPYKLWGHITFWSGLGIAAVGGVFTGLSAQKMQEYDSRKGPSDAQNQSKTYSGVATGMYVAGGALLVTGAVLWILSPGDKEWFEKHQVSAALAPDGRGLLLTGRW